MVPLEGKQGGARRGQEQPVGARRGQEQRVGAHELPMTLERKARGARKRPEAASRDQEEPEARAKRKARKGHKGA